MYNILKSLDIKANLATYWPCLLFLLAIAGLVSKSLYNYPMGIMALLGIYTLINNKQILKDKTIRCFIALFFCLWLPLLISLPDAVNYSHSSHTVFPYFRFLFAGIFIITEISKDPRRIGFINSSIFFIVLFWCLDACLQFFIGYDLFGLPYRSNLGITGMLGERNILSHICSILASFYFLYLWKRCSSEKLLIGISCIPLFFIIFLSGKRAAWLMLALSSIGFFISIYINSQTKKEMFKVAGLLSAVIGIIIGTTLVLHEPINQRFKTTLGLFSNDYETIDKATAKRLPLWETGVNIFKASPINGIGPRGYRYVYTEFSDPENYWHELTQTHPHLLILEILAETGLIGFIGYLLSLYLLLRFLTGLQNKCDIYIYLVPVLVALFPFNAHIAFYGSIWSSMTWLLISLLLAKARSVSS